MKKIFFYITIVMTAVIIHSCKKDLNEVNLFFPALNPAKLDDNAGTWKPILLNAPDEFAVAAPIATNAPDYIAQINEIKSWQNKLTAAEKNTVKYWSAGAVLRWNEIMRELVAKHNLPPYQNADGTYPVPSAANPLAYPQFPFANPPYAARAYAYVSAAMYDALVAAYHYKKLCNRPAPYKVDATVNVLIPKSDLPSYPSEDATVIGVAEELLKLLFPGDQDFIQQKAAEHKNARIISGANVRSDIDAGEALGKAVAQKFVTRARGDRAGAAVGIANGVDLWKEFETNAVTKDEIPWISQEFPKRPPMLPYFGRVKTFLFDSLTMVTQIRPAAPPSTKSDQFKKELEEVKYYSDNYDRERFRIVSFWADGVNTPTPPGHWNAIAAEAFVKQNFSEVRWARNMALLNMAMMDAAIVCWDAKYTYFNPRPSQVDPSIKTYTGLPNFPSYISGHSTFSGAAATILGYILSSSATDFTNMAKEASVSRLYGAIHYRSDIEVGLVVGNKVGTYAVQRASTDGAGN
ncbi:MAG: phosphatase PAP2 family protein [Sphingobacteriales bacterium]|nr:phosphatase PAP2 family protein [Sphingobacteriales bacterium]